MEAKQKQVCDIHSAKGFSVGLSNEQLRVGSEKAWKANIAGTLDRSRTRLNFEVVGGKVIDVNDKKSIPTRIKAILKERGIMDPNAGMAPDDKNRRRTVANIILQGSRDRMRELAFGDQQVNYERGADNSHITRNAAIEQWAVDMYNFMAKKYGEQNIAAFVVHLDETNPHIHCTLLPITENNKFSWHQVFSGKDKYEGSRRMKELHDELAEVNKKYGLARGESIAKTGAEHKSYLQWLQEQVAENNETLQEQRQLLYNLQGEIWKAEKKVKSFNTMLDKLEKQRLDVLAEIELLENEAINDEVEKDEIEAKLRQAKTDLQLTDDKIAQRKEQLKTATEQLTELGRQHAQIQNDYDDMRRQINRDLPTLHKKTIRDMESVGWKQAAYEANQHASLYEELKEYIRDFPTISSKFDEIFGGSMFEAMTTRATEMTTVATSLFLGYIDSAVQYAESAGGGGSSPDAGWGRRKEEDDLAFGRRCFLLAKNMLQPTEEETPKETRRVGRRR